jgi:hypothetical protein
MPKKSSNGGGSDYEIPMVCHDPVEFDMAADKAAAQRGKASRNVPKKGRKHTGRKPKKRD